MLEWQQLGLEYNQGFDCLNPEATRNPAPAGDANGSANAQSTGSIGYGGCDKDVTTMEAE